MSDVAATGQTVSFSVIETKIAAKDQALKRIDLFFFVKVGQSGREKGCGSLSFMLNQTQEYVYVVHENCSMLCMTNCLFCV